MTSSSRSAAANVGTVPYCRQAEKTAIPRPSLYRILETLRRLGYVRRAGEGERYELTVQVRTLSDGFKDEAWIREAALPVMEALQRRSGCACLC